MSSATETLIEYLRDAESAEQASISLLEGHLRGAPPGPFRTAMRRHLDETRRHAHQVGERLTDLGASRSPVGAAIGLGEAVVGRVVGLALAPVHVLGGRTGADQLVREAQDEIASEAREIAAYTVIERLAEEAGDDATASLARTIRGDEERHLETVRGLLEHAGRPRRARAHPLGRRAAGGRAGRGRGARARGPPAPDAATAAPTNGGPVKTERTERETPYRERAERRRAGEGRDHAGGAPTRRAASWRASASSAVSRRSWSRPRAPASPGRRSASTRRGTATTR